MSGSDDVKDASTKDENLFTELNLKPMQHQWSPGKNSLISRSPKYFITSAIQLNNQHK